MLPFTDLPSLRLLPEGAVFISDSATLVVADVHLGKSAAFRARGIAVPEGETAHDLGRLLALAKLHGAAHLVIAGDLFHAPSGMTPEVEAALSGFLEEIAIPTTLVLGNHDRKLRSVIARLNPVPHLDFGDALRVIHDPADATGERIHISGHWHPVVKIADGRRRSFRLPCFLLRDNMLVIPSFGSFTGGAIMATRAGDRVFVLLRDEIVELPEALISCR